MKVPELSKGGHQLRVRRPQVSSLESTFLGHGLRALPLGIPADVQNLVGAQALALKADAHWRVEAETDSKMHCLLPSRERRIYSFFATNSA